MILTFLSVVAALVITMALPALLGGMSLGKRRQQAIRDRETDRLRGKGYVVGVHEPEIFDADA
jgi:hypothetical protein